MELSKVFLPLTGALIMAVMVVLPLRLSVVAMVIVVAATLLLDTTPGERDVIVLGFSAGAVADIAMNLTARKIVGASLYEAPLSNWKTMVVYFNEVGLVRSALFAGALTAGMLCHAVWLAGFARDMRNEALPLTAFAVGALWGVVAELPFTKASRELMVFYKNTSGYLENRLWDGASIVVAAAFFALLSPGWSLPFLS